MAIQGATILFIGCVAKSRDFREALDTTDVDTLIGVLKAFKIADVLSAGLDRALAAEIARVATGGHMAALKQTWALPEAAMTLFWGAIVAERTLREVIEGGSAQDIATVLRQFKLHALLPGNPTLDELANNLHVLQSSGGLEACRQVWQVLQGDGPGIC